MIRKRKLFKRYLMLVLLVATIPMAAISFALYFGVSGQIERIADRNRGVYVENGVRTADNQLLSLERAALYWSGNDKLKAHLVALRDTSAIVQADQYEHMKAVLNMIGPMENSYELIDHIDIFLSDTRLELSNYGSCAEVIIPEELEFYRNVVAQQTASGWYPLKKSGHMVLAQEILSDDGRMGLFCITLDLDKLREMSLSLRMDATDTVLILTPGLELVTASGKEGDLYAHLINAVGNGGADALNTSVGGCSYRVLTSRFPKTGWRYILAVPLNHLTAGVKEAASLFLSISAACALLCAILAWQTSSRLYRPIGQLASTLGWPSAPDEIKQIEDNWNALIHEKNQVERRLNEGMAQFRENFLYQLLMSGVVVRSEEELRAEMGRLFGYEWPMYCRVAYVRLFGTALSKHGYQREDERMITYAARNLIAEGASDAGVSITPVLTGSQEICLFIAHSDDGRAQTRLIAELIRDLEDEVTRTLDVHVVAAVSHSSPRLSDLPRLREDAMKLYQYRNLAPANQFIDAKEHQAEERMRYPFDIENELMQQLLIGHLDGCAAVLGKLFAAFRIAGTAITYEYCIFQLLGNLQRIMLHHGFQPEQLILEDGMPTEALSNDVDDKERWILEHVLARYVQLVNEHQNIRLKQIVLETIGAIEQTYMRDVSLEYFADIQDVNCATLSRAFKRYTGKTFIDYLTDYRIAVAKKLLAETEMKVGDIAEAVGYRATYFNRIFKTHEDMTPGEYRSSVQRELE